MEGLAQQRRGIIETPHAKLEALVYYNRERGGGAAVILHPYALLGGSMQDHMVVELFRAAAASRAFSLVVRYNQRGVGRSSGSMGLRGKDDQVDVLAVVEWAAEQLAGHDKQVAVIGYSWGSCLAAYALSHPSVAAYVGVSFPLGGLSWVLQTKRHFSELCRASHLPRLLVLGDQDQFTGEAALRQAVLAAGGDELRQDDSFLPESAAAASPAVAAAAAAGTAAAQAQGVASSSSSSNGATGGSGTPAAAGLPGVERRQLLLRIFPDSDHFWMSYASLAAEYAVGWLESIMLPQLAAAAAAAAGAAPPLEAAAAAPLGAAVAPAAAAKESAASEVQAAAALAAQLAGAKLDSVSGLQAAAEGAPQPAA